MNKRFQRNISRGMSFVPLTNIETTVVVAPHLPKKMESKVIAVDQFFSQEHNLINGFISTSPALLDSAQGSAHFFPVDPETPMSSQFTDEDIHGMVISKKVQTKAEVSRVSELRPPSYDPNDDPDGITLEETPSGDSTPGDSE